MERAQLERSERGGRKIPRLVRLVSSLRFRLLALIFLVVLPALILTLFTDAAWRHHDFGDAEALVLSLARHAARHEEQLLRGSRELFGVLSQAAILHGDDSGCGRFLAAVKAFSPSYTDLAVVRLDGKTSCDASSARGSAVSAEHPLFRRVVKARDFVLGDYQSDPSTGKSRMRFAGPIFDGSGRLQAVGFGGVELDWLPELALGAPVPAGTTVTLIDRDGAIVAREPSPGGWMGRSVKDLAVFRGLPTMKSDATKIGDDVDGVSRLFAITRLRGPLEGDGLILAVGVPLTSTFLDADKILTRNLLALGGVCALAIIVAWIGVNLVLLRRVKALVGMAQRLSAGDLAARSGVADGAGELDLLADALDAMAVEIAKRKAEADHAEEELRSARDGMEQGVRERTADLAEANTALKATLADLQQAKEHLLASEAQLSAIVDSATDAIVTIDAKRRVLVFNRGAERIFRLPAAEIIGQPVERLIPERLKPALRYIVRGGVFNGQSGPMGPAALLRADGEEFPIEAATSRVTVQGNRLCTFILRDITERRRTEDALRKLSRAVEQTAEGVYITDCRGVIEYVNLAFERLTGYAREELIGATPHIISSGKHGTQFYERLWKTILSGRVFRDVFINRKKNGELYSDLQTISPIRNEQGDVSHFVASSRDFTQAIRTREALARLNAQLEQEAVRIAHALHDEAGQFLTVAHIALAELARDLDPPMRLRLQEVRQHLTQIEEQLRSLSHELRPRILEDLGLQAALAFLADGVSRRTGSLVTMQVDLEERLPPILETAIYRLVQEALTNSTRHAKATHIGVSLAREGEAIRCTIRDDGVGFDVSEIFGRKGGNSLGLIGIRDRLEALGGTLQMTSAPNEGTTLDVLIPEEALHGLPDSARG